MNNLFCKQFSPNIKFKYTLALLNSLKGALFNRVNFDRVILRGYIVRLFYAGGIVILLRALGFRRLSNGVMRLLTDQLNGHIAKTAEKHNIPIHWCLPALLTPVLPIGF